MKNIIFPEGLKLSHNFYDYEYEVYKGTFKSTVLEYGSESLLIFPDVFLYSELNGCSTSKLIDQWMEMAQKITTHLGGIEDTKLIYVSFDNIELSRNNNEWNIRRNSEDTTPVLKGDLIKTALFLSNRYDYIRLTKQLQFISAAYQDFDYLEYLKSNEVLETVTTSLEDYKKLGSLTSKLASYRETINNLETKLEEGNSSLTEFQLLMQSKDSKLQQLTASLDRCKSDLKSESDHKKRIIAEKDALSSSLEQSKSLIEKQELKLNEMDDELNIKQSELEKSMQDIELLNAQKSDLMTSLESTSAELQATREEVENLSADFANLKVSHEKCLLDIETKSGELEELKNLSLEKNAIRHDYDMAMDSYSSALEKLQTTLASLQQVELELASTKAKQEGQAQNINSLKLKNSTLTLELRQVNEQKSELEKRFDKSKSEFETLLSGQNKLLEEYKIVKGEQAGKISKLEQENAALFEQLTLTQLEFTKKIDSQDFQIEQLKAEKKETISKLIIAARDNTKLNSRLSKLKLSHNIVSYEKFLLENDSKYNNSILGRAKSVFASVKNIRRRGYIEARKEDARLIATSEYFDIEWYLETYNDVKESGVNPAEHYLLFGATEARMPSPKFDTLWYLERYPDVKESGINPLLHYVKYGQEEGRIASPKLIESVSFEKE